MYICFSFLLFIYSWAIFFLIDSTLSFWSLSNTQKPFLLIYTFLNDIQNINVHFDVDKYKQNKINSENIYETLQYLTVLTFGSKNIYLWKFTFFIKLKVNCYKPIYNNIPPVSDISTVFIINQNKYFVGTTNGRIYLFDQYFARRYIEICKNCIKFMCLFENNLICVIENGTVYRIKEIKKQFECNQFNINTLLNDHYRTKFKINKNIIPLQLVKYGEHFLNYLLIVTNGHVILINLYNNQFLILKELFESDIILSSFVYPSDENVIALVTLEKEQKSLLKMLNMNNTLHNCPLVVEGKIYSLTSCYSNLNKKNTEENHKLKNNIKCYNEYNNNGIDNIFVLAVDNTIIFYEEMNFVIFPFYKISYSRDKFVSCFKFSKNNKFLLCGFNDGYIYVYLLFNQNHSHYFKDYSTNKLSIKEMNQKYCISVYTIQRITYEKIDKIEIENLEKMKLLIFSNHKKYIYNLFENQRNDITFASSDYSFFKYNTSLCKLANTLFEKNLKQISALKKESMEKQQHDDYWKKMIHNTNDDANEIMYVDENKKDFFYLYIFKKIIFLLQKGIDELEKMIMEQRIVLKKEQAKDESKSNENYQNDNDDKDISNDQLLDQFNKKYVKHSVLFQVDIEYTQLHMHGTLFLCSFKNAVFIYKTDHKNNKSVNTYGLYNTYFNKNINLAITNSSENLMFHKFEIVSFENDFLSDSKDSFFFCTHSEGKQNTPAIMADKKEIEAEKQKEQIKTKVEKNNKMENLLSDNRIHSLNVFFTYNDCLSFDNIRKNHTYYTPGNFNKKNSFHYNYSAFNSNEMKQVLCPEYTFASPTKQMNYYKLKAPYILHDSNDQAFKNKKSENPTLLSNYIYLEENATVEKKQMNDQSIFYYKIIQTNEIYDIIIYVTGGIIKGVEKTSNNSLRFFSGTTKGENVMELTIPSYINLFEQKILMQINSSHSICYLSLSPINNKKE